MSNRFERESERAGGGRSSTSMMRLFGQMLMLPFTVFVYGMEVFVRTVQGVQRIADEGLDLTAGGVAPAREDAEPGGRRFTSDARVDAGTQASGQWADVSNQQESGAAVVAARAATTGSVAPARTESQSEDKTKEKEMDRDLRDDMLKLVRYKILFVKREYEHAFPEQEDLVSENMDGAAFTAWKVAEFIQELQRGETRVPEKWRKYHGGKYCGDGGGGGKGSYVILRDLPHEDKKYLRVYYEVMDRYPREKFKYEEQQIRVLEEIRDEIRDCNDE